MGPAAATVLPEEPVSLVVEEKLVVVLNKDGGLESMEVQGTMSLQVGLVAWQRLVVQSLEVHVSMEMQVVISLRKGGCTVC